MISLIDQVLEEGNCGRATDRGEEACECVRKYRPDFAVGRTLFKAARLRTETPYKAGSGRRVSTTSRSRSQTPAQVNGELAQRSITLLSGETCRDGMRAAAAPTSKACLKTRNALAKAIAGAAGVSRGRSSDPSHATEDAKDRTMKKEESLINSMRGNLSSTEETKGSLSRPGLTAPARIKKPALSLLPESLKEAAVGASNLEPALLTPLVSRTQILR